MTLFRYLLFRALTSGEEEFNPSCWDEPNWPTDNSIPLAYDSVRNGLVTSYGLLKPEERFSVDQRTVAPLFSGRTSRNNPFFLWALPCMGVRARTPIDIPLHDREWQSQEDRQETQADPLGSVNHQTLHYLLGEHASMLMV